MPILHLRIRHFMIDEASYSALFLYVLRNCIVQTLCPFFGRDIAQRHIDRFSAKNLIGCRVDPNIPAIAVRFDICVVIHQFLVEIGHSLCGRGRERRQGVILKHGYIRIIFKYKLHERFHIRIHGFLADRGADAGVRPVICGRRHIVVAQLRQGKIANVILEFLVLTNKIRNLLSAVIGHGRLAAGDKPYRRGGIRRAPAGLEIGGKFHQEVGCIQTGL